MCLIVFAWRPDSELPLVLAANRDEFHARPTAAAHFWADEPQVLAGRDLQAGGTWLGISRSGRFAAITNIRDPGAREGKAARSRGELTRGFLCSDQLAEDYLSEVAARVDEYQGFNLIVAEARSLWYLHGSVAAGAAPRRLEAGVYGLSNAALDVPWPKVRLARSRLQALIEQPGIPGHAELRACLQDRELADAAELERQGLAGEMAQRLSAQFIVTAEYGTRCATTLLRDSSGRQSFAEQRFDAGGEVTGSDSFSLDPA